MNSTSADNEMNKILDKCEKLPIWAKTIIQKIYKEVSKWDGDLSLWGALKYNHITSEGAIMLFNGLNQMKSTISKIYLDMNQLNDECMKSLGEFIDNCKNLEVVYLGNNKITDKGIEVLSEYLKGNTTYKELMIYNNHGVTDKSIPHLVKALETSCIIDLQTGGCSIENERVLIVPIINNVLKYGYNKIDLSYRSMTDDDVIRLCQLIKKYGGVKLAKKDLSGNKITSNGAIELFETLKETKSSIVCIDLDGNELDDSCMISLGEFLESSRCTQGIKIAENKITDKGIEMLSEYLIGDVTLKSFDFSWNRGITDKSLPHLIDIAKLTSIIFMDFNCLSVSENNKIQVKNLLKIPIDKREIPIKSLTKSAAKIQ